VKSESRDFLDTISIAALGATLLMALPALYWGSKALAGVLAGGLLAVGGLRLSKHSVAAALRSGRPRLWLGVTWVVKFPLLCTLLYLLIAKDVVNPIAFCLGVGVLPLAFLVAALRPVRSEA